MIVRDTKLGERLFWMEENTGMGSKGHLMTMEQLLSELPKEENAYEKQYGDYFRDGEREATGSYSTRKNMSSLSKEQVEEKLSEGNGSFQGRYEGTHKFVVKEVKSREELVNLLTWKNYDPTKGVCAVPFKEFKPYPLFVGEDVSLPVCVLANAEELGITSRKLPSGKENDTVSRYAATHGIDIEKDGKYFVSDKEKFSIEVSKMVEGDGFFFEKLTPESYMKAWNDCCNGKLVSSPLMNAEEEERDDI